MDFFQPSFMLTTAGMVAWKRRASIATMLIWREATGKTG